MRHDFLTGALCVAIIAGASLASASEHGGHKGPRFDFDKVDTDGDGAVSKEEMLAYRTERFLEMDADGDGLVSVEEMRTAMQVRANARIEERLAKMMTRHDANNDGALSVDEMTQHNMNRMFGRLDADGDGVISRAEYEAMKSARTGRKSKD